MTPKPWEPWTKVFDQPAQRNLWCASSPCELTQQPGSTPINVGTPDDWLGLYDPALVQKFVFTHSLSQQALFTSGDFRNQYRYPGENLYRLHAMFGHGAVEVGVGPGLVLAEGRPVQP